MSVALNYRIDGEGMPLVLLHPVGLDLTFFDSLTAELSSRYRVLRVDLRGHGKSPLGTGSTQPRIEDYAKDVHALLHAVHHAPTVVIGFSFGGMVAQELALHHPEDVIALVASACGCTFTEQTRNALRARGAAVEQDGMSAVVESTLERWFSAAYRERGDDTPARDRLLHDNITSWQQTWNAISELNTEPRLHTIRIPALCLAGENDVSTPPALVRSLAEKIPGARFAVIPDAPHMLFLEKLREVAESVIDFLVDLPARSTSDCVSK